MTWILIIAGSCMLSGAAATAVIVVAALRHVERMRVLRATEVEDTAPKSLTTMNVEATARKVAAIEKEQAEMAAVYEKAKAVERRAQEADAQAAQCRLNAHDSVMRGYASTAESEQNMAALHEETARLLRSGALDVDHVDAWILGELKR